ncbi:hypothetical protein GCM10027271_31090 [Saccharopolyspora gloriosae]|uniref:CBS domain-containing protein n=1 Tax=Saccharopolyspora gloriosae TaxID=455344 RepID=A0A840NG62_9PSEU|nr:CBS domain-containing protein [Saccharopolyspora gloriosae]MBB5069991.1 CBS domain-containing protein [Saccharopolyspora gloriosae]
MLVSEAYHPGALTCASTDSLPDAASTMTEHHVGSLAVVDGNIIVGIISERDITRAVAQQASPHHATAADFASQHVTSAKLDDDTLDVARRMLDTGVRHMPVVKGSTVVGVVSMRDLLAVEAWI